MSHTLSAAPTASLAPSRELALRFAWVALVAACLIRSRPYLGIVHDGIQYAAQALEHLNPEIYRNDIYFRLGSQDQYTLFSPIFAFLVSHLGLGHAYMALVIVFLALFLGASYLLVRGLVPAGLQGVAMLFIATSNGHYGPHRIFRMAEAVVSPRPLAEIGTLLALLLLFRGRQYAALALLGVCALLHPLVALAGMLYWGVYVLLSGGDRRLLIACALAPVAAALAGLAPFDQLFARFDPEWFERVYEMNRHLFISYWAPGDWSRVAFDIVALHMAVRLGDEKTRTVFRAAIWTGVLAVLATFLGADVLHDVLLTNLQPWRALWIVHWLALAATPIVVVRLWPESHAGRLIVGLLLFAFATRGLTTSLGASLLAVALFAGRAQVALGARMAALLLVALAGGALASWIASDRALFASPLFPLASAEVPILRVLSRTFPLLVIASAVYWFTLRRRAQHAAAALAGILLALSVFIWDQRSPFARYVDSTTPGQHPFSKIIPPGDQVWWYGENLGDGRNLTLSWLVLERASYVSAFQHVGQHFDRARTLELHRRDELVLPFSFQLSLCGIMELVNPNEPCQPEFDALEELCREATGLDYLILDANYPGKWLASWTPPLAAGGPIPRYYLYACKNIAAR